MLKNLICDKPHVGIIASVSGFGASFLSLLQGASVVIGFFGAVFGLAAGYYTWRIKREHWHKLNSHTLSK